MKTATKKGRAAAWGVPLANELAAFGRSIVLARLLGPEELGKTMLLALALRLVEMVGDVSIEKLLAQASDGGSARMQANLQGIAILRGALISLILLALAWPMSMAFEDGPELKSFALLALAPLLSGFVHLDYRRKERSFNYRGLVLVDGGAAVVMFLSAPVWSVLVGDHRAFLGILFVHVVALLMLSHLLAERRYRVALHREYIDRVWRFGAPLILNAGLMFLTFYADRLIVAVWFSWAELGLYGVALQLAFLPAQITGRAAGSLLTPAFRRAIHIGILAGVAQRAQRTYLALSIVFLVGFGLLAAPLIRAVYGAGFEADNALIWALALAAAIRIARTPASTLAVSLGQTAIPLRGNVLRALAILPALLGALLGAPLFALALVAAIGEAFAMLRVWTLLKPCLIHR